LKRAADLTALEKTKYFRLHTVYALNYRDVQSRTLAPEKNYFPPALVGVPFFNASAPAGAYFLCFLRFLPPTKAPVRPHRVFSRPVSLVKA
jgi:hypothetical protein